MARAVSVIPLWTVAARWLQIDLCFDFFFGQFCEKYFHDFFSACFGRHVESGDAEVVVSHPCTALEHLLQVGERARNVQSVLMDEHIQRYTFLYRSPATLKGWNMQKSTKCLHVPLFVAQSNQYEQNKRGDLRGCSERKHVLTCHARGYATRPYLDYNETIVKVLE